MDADSLPEYLGGTSKATLLDDAGPWQDPKVLAQVEAANARARKAGGGKHISEESGDESDGHSREGVRALMEEDSVSTSKSERLCADVTCVVLCRPEWRCCSEGGGGKGWSCRQGPLCGHPSPEYAAHQQHAL